MLPNHWSSLQAAVLCVCLMGIGCSSASSAGTGLSPVRGKVLVDGKPAGYAAVTLTPVGKQAAAGGMADANGDFRLNTRGFDGAEPGEYLVTVSWALPTNPNATEKDFGPELLPAKFQDPKKSGLKAVVEAKETLLPPFDLKP